MKRVLIACESSGIVRDAFRAAGFDAWSCDLLPADGNSNYHIQGDAIEAIYDRPWDVLIAHPPCTYLCSSGLHWNKRTGLWLHNLPLLRATSFVEPREVDGRSRWGNQTDSGQNRLGPSADRWKVRSQTYFGVAKAMACQWGQFVSREVAA